MFFAPHAMGIGFPIAILGMLLFWGGVAVLVIWAVRSFTNRPLPVPPLPPTPRQILDERLARGETTVTDYEKARAALEKAD
jgi:hypothetical protein